ncbi:MAG: ABC transporter ATP-binding protein [Calditrichaeota bacterium]|nr:ABC transporter ATP-binding protein [Calditrichota bacterium]
MNNQNQTAIEIVNLTKIYNGTVHAVRQVSITIKRGEMVLIRGPNGSGKTTLLSMIGCLTRPTEGTIKIMGKEITALSQSELTQFRLLNIGFIFQTFRLLDFLNVRENIELVLNLRGVPSGYSREIAREVLEEVEMLHRASFYPDVLSGGEKQRVAVARAFANEASLILADEPTGSLDSKAGKAIIRLLCEAAEKKGKTVLIASHDDRIVPFAHRILEMEDGKLRNTHQKPGWT